MVFFAINKYHYSNQRRPTNIFSKKRLSRAIFLVKTAEIATRHFQSFVALLPFYPYTSNYQFPVTDQEN